VQRLIRASLVLAGSAVHAAEGAGVPAESGALVTAVFVVVLIGAVAVYVWISLSRGDPED